MAKPVALITGASYGLGYALAKEAAKSGYHVMALGRTQGALDDLADEIEALGGDVTIVPMDITNDDVIAYLAQSISERWGKLDLWLHTAWFTAPMQPVAHLIAKDLDKAWNTNIRATARLIAVLEPIIRSGKAVFFDQDNLDRPLLGNIGTSKTAQMQIVRTWAGEAKALGTDVQIVTPAPFYSNLTSTLAPGKKRKDYPTPAEIASQLWAQIQA